MASVTAWTAFPTEFLSQTTAAGDLIVAKMEDYLIKIFGYPKAFLMVLAKASFGRQPVPIVSYESFLTKTWNFVKEIEDIMNVLTPALSEVTIKTGHLASYQHKGTQTINSENENSLVQITATTEEINRRINSFIQRKRQEVDVYNKREFCVFRSNREESTCARTDAAFVPRQGKKSLLKTYRVYNKPDTSCSSRSFQKAQRMKRPNDALEPFHPSTSLALRHIPAETYERVDNLHVHLLSRPMDVAKEDKQNFNYPVLDKIKALEDRVLYLEGLSPEYFNQNIKEIQNDGRSLTNKACPFDSRQGSLVDAALMDKRISELRDMLQSKSYSHSKT